MASLEGLHKSLLTEWSKTSPDLDTIGKLLADLKDKLNDAAQLATLSPMSSSTVHKDYFEIKALFHVRRADMDGFQEAIADVHSFYQCQAQESTNKYLMFGLHLMYLIAANKLSEFHMLLEQIDLPVQQTNAFISMPVNLEQSLMEGAYNKVTLNQKAIPSPYYEVFVRVLMDTVRNDIATCMEKSFKHLLVKDATQMLLFQSDDQLLAFAKSRGWQIDKDVLRFDLTQIQVDGTPKSALDTKRITLQNIYYAKQLEMIV